MSGAKLVQWSKSLVEVAHLCLTLVTPVDHTVHGILQARILQLVAYPFSSRSSRPRKERGSPVLQVDSLPTELSGKLKVIRESQCQPGPDCREYNAGS